MAKTLGRTLDELAASMSGEEYSLWLAWHQPQEEKPDNVAEPEMNPQDFVKRIYG